MLRIAVRNHGGAWHPHTSNPYRAPEHQSAAFADTAATGAEVLLLQEVTGGGPAFAVPTGWRFDQPFSKADRGGASVVVVVEGRDADLTWRPDHPVLRAFGAYLDFALLRAGGLEVVLASVHVPTKWYPEHWKGAGRQGPMPSGPRPWPSDVILDGLIEAIGTSEAVVAGDWNEDVDWPGAADADAAAFLQRAQDAGWLEAVSSTFKGKVRTNFAVRTVKPYQNDKVFLTPELARRLRSVAVWHEPDSRVSDHAGLLVTLDL